MGVADRVGWGHRGHGPSQRKDSPNSPNRHEQSVSLSRHESHDPKGTFVKVSPCFNLFGSFYEVTIH